MAELAHVMDTDLWEFYHRGQESLQKNPLYHADEGGYGTLNGSLAKKEF
jgi:hypothetical protein